MALRLTGAALTLAAIGTTAAAANGAECSSTECPGGQDEEAAALLQSRFQTAAAPRSSGVALAAASEASAAETSRRHELIEELFAEVTEGGGYFDPFSITKREKYVREAFEEVKSNGKPISSALRPEDRTWEKCTNIDWSSIIAKLSEDGTGGEVESEALDEMVDDLGLGMCFDNKEPMYKDATCAAVRASIMSALKMTKEFVKGPIFANYSVVAWGKNPSWTKGAVSGVDYTKPLPIHATLHNPNGVVGYAVCDILRTVLTQSANQMGSGSCSHVASLAAVSHKAPAIAIKLAVRALWTGEVTQELGAPCPRLFDQQPGLVPFANGPKDNQQWFPSFFPGLGPNSSPCLGNPADCEKSSGSPLQNAGTTFMWSQSLISTWLRENFDSCPEDVARAGIAYPGMTEADAKLVGDRAGGSASSMLWACNRVVDPKGGSCKVVFNKNLCGDVPDAECIKLIGLEPDGEVRQGLGPATTRANGKVFELGITKSEDVFKVVVDEWKSYAKPFPRLAAWIDTVLQVAHDTGLPPGTVASAGSLSFPSFTDSLLEEVCKENVVLLMIDATPLQKYNQAQDIMASGLPFFGNFVRDGKTLAKGECNHAVYLEKCMPAENTYVIWSWGSTYNVTKEWLIGYPTAILGEMDNIRNANTFNTGMVCGSVVADKVTVF